MIKIVRRLRERIGSARHRQVPHLAVVRARTETFVGPGCAPTRDPEQALLFASEEEAVRFLSRYACDPHELVAPAVALSRSLLR